MSFRHDLPEQDSGNGVPVADDRSDMISNKSSSAPSENSIEWLEDLPATNKSLTKEDVSEVEAHNPTDSYVSENTDSAINQLYSDKVEKFASDSESSEQDSLEIAVEPKPRFNRHAIFFPFFFFVVLADQFTKALAVYKLGYLKGDPTLSEFMMDYFSRIREFPWRLGEDGYKPAVEVIDGFFRWQLTTNTGAAFSMFSDYPVKLAIVSAVLSVFLYFLYIRFGKGSVIWPIAFGLQIGGAIGNFLDRARLGEVVDFIATKSPGLIDGRLTLVDFPIYNIADACAVVGTVLIGIMFVIKDVTASYLAKKSRFELMFQQSTSLNLSTTIHPLEHSIYSAEVELLPIQKSFEEEVMVNGDSNTEFWNEDFDNETSSELNSLIDYELSEVDSDNNDRACV